MKSSKNSFYKSWAPKLIFSNENLFRKIQIIFYIERWLWKSEFWNFAGLITLTKNVVISGVLASVWKVFIKFHGHGQNTVRDPVVNNQTFTNLDLGKLFFFHKHFNNCITIILDIQSWSVSCSNYNGMGSEKLGIIN